MKKIFQIVLTGLITLIFSATLNAGFKDKFKKAKKDNKNVNLKKEGLKTCDKIKKRTK